MEILAWLQRVHTLVLLTIACFLFVPGNEASAADRQHGIAVRSLTFVDDTRGIKATMGFAGSDTRRIDVRIWHPAEIEGGPYPLIVYSHGTFGFASNAMHFVGRW